MIWNEMYELSKSAADMKYLLGKRTTVMFTIPHNTHLQQYPVQQIEAAHSPIEVLIQEQDSRLEPNR